MALKIGFLGLDAAGKTSFLSVLSSTYSSVIEPPPTKGIERSTKDIIGQSIDLWDFGGQKQYRDRYLRSDKDLIDFDLVYYLIDVQDLDRFDESGDYLDDLLEKIDDFDQGRLIVCFHKCDPDLREDLKNQLRVARQKMENIADDAYAFLQTSIFDEKTIIRAFSIGLRKIATKEEIIINEVQTLCEDVGIKGVVLLSIDGFVMASYVTEENLKEKLEAVGISLSKLWQTNRVVFEEIVGKADFGDFRFDKVTTSARDYFVLASGTSENYDLERIKWLLDSLG
ncbi:MAG: ADP-ribosylation factor-like protein [Candidatus Hodarchaeales archaeon]|jgi:GTPase SAR1 family protein